LSNGKEFICEEELRRIGLSGREEFFSGRRIGQFAYLSGRKELVTQKKREEICLSKRRDCSKNRV
jgi:hypothetical protein